MLASDAPSNASPATAVTHGPGSIVGWIAALVVGVAIGAWWFGAGRGPETGLARQSSAVSAQPPAVEPSPDTPPAPPPTPEPAVPPEPPPPPPSPPAVPPALEDVVSRVMPAVVLVQTSAGRGSGFFVAPDTIITNAHVAGSDTSVTIRRADGNSVPARVERVAPDIDLAVLKTAPTAQGQTLLALAPTGHVRTGQEVLAVGSPLGVLQNSVTRGIVSSVRQVGRVTLVQTDAASNPGNSGGPLVDRDGRVVGIMTLGVAGSQGLAFAVAADHARQLLEGGPSPAGSAPTPSMALTQTLQGGSGQPDAEMRRTQGTRAYEGEIARIGQRADNLDDYWRRFAQSCLAGDLGRGARSFSRTWFVLLTPGGVQGAVAHGCEPAFADVRRAADAIKTDVLAAEETARRADVYPGQRRDVRRKYRLDDP